MRDRLIKEPRTVIPALDCPPARAAEIARGCSSVALVRAVKLGAWKGTIRSGIDAYMQAIGPYLGDIEPIYDHQKGGTDIPDLEDSLPGLVDAGVHALILFPFGGCVTQRRWTKSAMDAGLTVIVGGHMTQEGFLYSDGGYVHDEAPERIYRSAVGQGVRDFVVPGNQPGLVEKYKAIIEDELRVEGLPDEPFVLYAPGFVKQGGVISETGKVAGPLWHAIVGSALVNAEDVEAVARDLTSQLSSA